MRPALKLTLVLLLLAAVPASAAQWRVPGDFATIQDAIDDPAVQNGDTILVGPGHFAGALVTKSVHIKGFGWTVIDSGPMHPAGLVMGFRLLNYSDGTTISRLIFKVDLAIMNGDGVDDVNVKANVFLNPIQAVSNWRGSRWTISYNVIKDLRSRNGGGIGVLVGDYGGGFVTGNVVSHNLITGTLHVWSDDGGGYNGTGIVLYADFRWGRAGTTQMDLNRVFQNTVGLESDTPDVVDVVGIELTDTRDDPALRAIVNNRIWFNDLSRTAEPIVLTPSTLDQYNEIWLNTGKNLHRGPRQWSFGWGSHRFRPRGGAHPRFFGPR